MVSPHNPGNWVPTPTPVAIRDEDVEGVVAIEDSGVGAAAAAAPRKAATVAQGGNISCSNSSAHQADGTSLLLGTHSAPGSG